MEKDALLHFPSVSISVRMNDGKPTTEPASFFTHRQQRTYFCIIIGLYLCLAIGYNLAIPPFETPDEHHHFFTVQQLATTRQLPVASPQTLARQEAAQPPLYYLVGALLLSPMDVQDIPIWYNPFLDFNTTTTTQNVNAFIHANTGSDSWAVHWLRFYSSLLGAGTVLLVYASARLLWPASVKRPLFAMSLVAFWPQFLFIHSSVSNDSLITLLSSAVLFQLIRLWAKGVNNKSLLVLGGTIGLAIISKMTGLLLLPLALIVMGGLLWQNGRSPKQILLASMRVVLPVVLLSGWLFWRNWHLYGDVTAVNQFVALAGGERPYTLAQVWHDMGRVWPSLFAFFGWMTVRPPQCMYTIWNGFVLFAVAGGALSLISAAKTWMASDRNWSWTILWHPAVWLSGWFALVLLAWLRFMLLTPADQGRLWFPAILPMALGLAYGLSQWGWRWVAPIVSGLALITAVFGLLTIQNAYSPPPLLASAAEIPASATRLDAQWGDGLSLLAVEMEQETAVSGDWVWLTLYWQAEAVPSQAPILEFHAIGRNYERVGLTQSYHGGGHYPANLWSSGQIVADRIGVQLKPTMQTPTQLRLNLQSGTDGDSILLGQLPVSAASSPPLTTDPIAHIGDDLLLLQTDLATTTAAPGETITVTLGWQVVNAPKRPLTAFIHLGDPTQVPVAQIDAPPLLYDYPPSIWQPTDILTDTYTLIIPADLENGRYPLQTGFYDSETAVRLPVTVNSVQQPHNGYLIDWISIDDKK